MAEEIINRVANSVLETINLEKKYPTAPLVSFDIKDFLFKELLLKEKEYREALKTYDWSQFEGKHVAVFCSTDAILPSWAFLLPISYLQGHCETAFQGSKQDLLKFLYYRAIDEWDLGEYAGKPLIIKGCSHKEVPNEAYSYLLQKLQPIARSIMYGEACSSVPIFKRK